jgi:hypothetical protein
MEIDDRKFTNLDEFNEIVENVKYLHMSPDKKTRNNNGEIGGQGARQPRRSCDTVVEVVVGIDDDLQMILDMDPSIIDYKVDAGPKSTNIPMTNSGYLVWSSVVDKPSPFTPAIMRHFVYPRFSFYSVNFSPTFKTATPTSRTQLKQQLQREQLNFQREKDIARRDTDKRKSSLSL